MLSITTLGCFPGLEYYFLFSFNVMFIYLFSFFFLNIHNANLSVKDGDIDWNGTFYPSNFLLKFLGLSCVSHISTDKNIAKLLP